jgi:hypothetical protein
MSESFRMPIFRAFRSNAQVQAFMVHLLAVVDPHHSDNETLCQKPERKDGGFPFLWIPEQSEEEKKNQNIVFFIGAGDVDIEKKLPPTQRQGRMAAVPQKGGVSLKTSHHMTPKHTTIVSW